MNSPGFHIIPYDSKYEEQTLQLERLCPQGKKIKFEITREHILSRAEVFNEYHALLALDDTTKMVIGFAAVAICPLLHQELKIHAGIGFDLKVHPAYRQRGIARALGKESVEGFLIKKKINHYYMTLKKSNENTAKAAKVIPLPWTYYDFIYLTISTKKRIKTFDVIGVDQPLNVVLFEKEKSTNKYILDFESNLKLWRTYDMYQLKIQHWPWYMDLGARIYNSLVHSQKAFPTKSSNLKFATLFNFNTENIVHINSVLKHLDKEGIQFLNVCCTSEDSIYNVLKPFSTNELEYTMMNTSNISSGSDLKIDVRCL